MLVVAATLIPSESAVSDGTHVVWIMAWLVLAAAGLVSGSRGANGRWRFGGTETLVVLFLVMHSASALVMLSAGEPRLTLNAMWLWIACGLLLLATRQWFRSPRSQRALASALMALAVGLSVYGFYQVGYSDPLLRARYAQDPEQTLRDAGIDAPPGSPQRYHWESRLASREPIGSFALTNSLAGFLTPCLLLLVYVAGSFRGRASNGWPYAVNVAGLTLAVAGCLVLTKSRSAYGAALLGLALLALTRAVPRRRLRWHVLVGVMAAAIIATGLVVRLGGLDRQVVTEAPKSLTFRLQYWQATAAMIADHPWFGCGPGSFKSCYTRYKLPEASEEISDPHNFLLEVAATAGVPALAVFVFIGVVLAVQLRRYEASAAGAAYECAVADTSAGAVYSGALIGFAAAYPAGWAGGLAPDPALWWVAFPAAAVTLWLLHPWVMRGTLPAGPLVVAGCALLTNLLAAGGIGFPGVGQLVWLLAALALNAADHTGPERGSRSAGPPRRRAGWAVAAWGACLLTLIAACYITMYRPVLAARRQLYAAREATTASLARERLSRAADADPWSAAPWESLAQLEWQQWMAAPSDAQLHAFLATRDALLQRNRGSSTIYRQCGDWLLAMFAITRSADLGREAVQAYCRAVELYPHSGILHAQLAWACHVTDARELAREHAQEALRLDALMPHSEFKLARQRLVAEQLGAVDLPARDGQGGLNAEQLMQRIRNVKIP